MEKVPEKEFFRIIAELGIGFDPRYPDSRCLSIQPHSEHARFWVVSEKPGTWPHFLRSLIGGLDNWSTGWLWPRPGVWPQAERAGRDAENVRKIILKGAGVPDGWRGALRLRRDETDKLLAVLFAYLAFGWCVDDDLFFVPDHGKQLLQTDHHDVVYVECTTEKRILKLVQHMSKEDYDLPAKPPDWTFKRPAWMSGSA